MTKHLITALLILGISGAMAQTKPQNNIVDTTLMAKSQGFDMTPDTIFTITYCLNTVTLETKWIRLRALQGFTYPSAQINSIVIYNKYLNVPKDYKAIYSVTQ